jgi:amidophosphoribosyltransferase
MCGIFGVFGHPEASNLAYLGLHALQHRGQESAGIVASDGQKLVAHRAMGLVQSAFSPKDLEALPGDAAIGHVRYSTAGGSFLRNAQPISVDYSRGSLAVAHNGNLVNYAALRERLEARGSIFQTSSDTETIVHLVAMSTQRAIEARIADALAEVQGAYSLLFLTPDALIATRDPNGIRPLCLGKLKRAGFADAVVVASEPTAFELIGASYERDIAPGEMLIVTAEGARSIYPFEKEPRRTCLFEHVYFARPDARLEGASVYEVRKSIGRRLAAEHPLAPGEGPAVVVPVPDSGVPAAIGYAEACGLPFEMGLIRSHYVGRTFIEPQQSIRHFGVKLKLLPQPRRARGAPRGGGRRLHRARHDQPQDRAHAARRGRQGGARAHLQPAHRVALLLRHRHAHALRADRVEPQRERDRQVPRGRLHRLREPRRARDRGGQGRAGHPRQRDPRRGPLPRVFLGRIHHPPRRNRRAPPPAPGDGLSPRAC